MLCCTGEIVVLEDHKNGATYWLRRSAVDAPGASPSLIQLNFSGGGDAGGLKTPLFSGGLGWAGMISSETPQCSA